MRRVVNSRWSGRTWGSFALAALTAVAGVGCGGSSSVAEKTTPEPATVPQQPGATPAELQAPESVVSEFLDGVRRGGTASDIGRLMTAKSREQYAAVGLVMQPLGAPDAKFEVTRSVPWGESGVLVNSLWTEKLEDGSAMTYEVAWALKQEPEGWRVSGLILGDEPPRIFNFESREDVLAIKQMQEGELGAEEEPARTADGGFQMPELR